MIGGIRLQPLLPRWYVIRYIHKRHKPEVGEDTKKAAC